MGSAEFNIDYNEINNGKLQRNYSTDTESIDVSDLSLHDSSDVSPRKDVDIERVEKQEQGYYEEEPVAGGSDDGGLVSAMTRAVRRSLRRVKRLRNSFGHGRRGEREGQSGERRDIEDSEEVDERRRLPDDPNIGLPSVRSPSTSAILLPSLVAALSPRDSCPARTRDGDPLSPRIAEPRETLTPPPSSPRQRRNGSRSAARRFAPPPLSPSRHIPHNLNVNSFRTANTSPTTPITSPQRTNAQRNSRTLPTDTTRPSALYNLTTNPSGDDGLMASVTRPHSRRTSSDVQISTISNNILNGGESNGNDLRHSPSHSNISAVLISPVHVGSSRVSPSRNVSSPVSRTTSPSHRNDRTSTSSSNTRRQGGRRGERRSVPHQRGARTPTSPTHSTTSTRTTTSTSRNPASTTDNNNGAARPCNRTNPTTTPSSNVNTSPDHENTNNQQTNGDNNNNNNNNSSTDSPNRRRRSSGGASSCSSSKEYTDPWPHQHSGLLASLGATVTIFNISRFAVLGATFGWPFLVQWLIVSLVLGVPLLTLHVALGQHTGLGALQLWRVAPIFQGVGLSLVAAQLMLGVYCSVPIAWLFVYFRDSFVTENNVYAWASCRPDLGANCTRDMNLSQILPQAIPSYLRQVQQRSAGSTWQEALGSLKFNLTFNVVLVWLITLVVLCRGNKVYGRVNYLVFIIPLLCFLAVCVYIASWTRDDLSFVPDFTRAFMNSTSWVAASREVFLVWGLHGPVLQQMAVHNRRGQGIKCHIWLLVMTTVLVLVLAAVTGSCCAASLRQVGLKYSPSSFETTESATFLVPKTQPSIVESLESLQTDLRSSSSLSNTLSHGLVWEDLAGRRPHRDGRDVDYGHPDTLLTILAARLMDSYLRYDSLYVGIRISCPEYGNLHNRLFRGIRLGSMKQPPGGACSGEGGIGRRSGYQGLRLATELFPAFLGVHGALRISPFWSSLFYLSLLLFGIAQQLAVWRTIVEVVVCSTGLQRRRGLVTGCVCLMGLSASLPLATQLGPDLLFFMDYVIGCAWWLMILQLVQVFAILFVRGKPVAAQDLISSIGGFSAGNRVPGWSVHITAFACSILVPVGLLVLSISSFKSGHYREVFAWSSNGYWPVWVSQLASGLQLFPILLVPLVALGQTCRYLAKSQYDIFHRIQMLYRPPFQPRFHVPRPPTPPLLREDEDDTTFAPTIPASPAPFSDPPPKYTPPPSYSTATGLGIAKALNQSVRRSIRHLRSSLRLSENPVSSQSGTDTSNTSETTQVWTTQQQQPYIPPPDYTADASTLDDPPLYATLDPVARQKVMRVLQKAGMRRNINSGFRASARRLQNGGTRCASTDEALVSDQPATLELQGMDHLSFDHEVV